MKRAYFLKQWKSSVIVPIVKPDKENSDDVSKRPTSLINLGGKVLEKLLINRILHHLYTNKLLSENQYGFKPQTSTTYAAMAVKEFIECAPKEKNSVLFV